MIVLLWKLFFTFLKIGLFTFGGGYAMVPLMQEQVLAHGWATEAEIINFIAVAESTPGPIAINMATYIGTETAGFIGAFFATLGVVLPSFTMILIVAKCYEKFRRSFVVGGCMSGLKPAVIGLIASAVLSIGGTVFFAGGVLVSLTQASFWLSLLICVLALLLAFEKKTHPIVLICLSAALGIAFGYLADLPVG